MIATKNDILNNLKNPSVIILDDRDKAEWVGASSSPYGIDFVPRRGHIPGSKWIEWYEFMNTKGKIAYFKSAEQIRNLCKKNNIDASQEIIIYCFKGSRASNTYMALKLAGIKEVRVYLASWNEWGRDIRMPIEK